MSDTQNLEEAFHELDQLIEKMESGQISLEDSLRYYEQGTQLLKTCHTILANAEHTIQVLDEQMQQLEPLNKESLKTHA